MQEINIGPPIVVAKLNPDGSIAYDRKISN